jgi:hypothetical protein
VSVVDRPVLRVRFTLADGTPLERDWTMADVDEKYPAWIRGVPDWLEDPRRGWAHPQDPITYTGRVKPGCEAEAIETVMG